MPPGFLGSRADLLVDTVLVTNLVAPFWAYGAARLIRQGRTALHMRLQIALWALLFVNVLVLEGWIRWSGGSGSLVAGSAYEGTALLRGVFLLHILPATATYLVWAGLVFLSFRRRHLPALGGFAPRHRLAGRLVVAGLVWTALSALAVYYLSFVA